MPPSGTASAVTVRSGGPTTVTVKVCCALLPKVLAATVMVAVPGATPVTVTVEPLTATVAVLVSEDSAS